MGKILKKNDLNRFLYNLKTTSELIAPVKEDKIRFKSIKFVSEIYLDEIPDFSPKKFFIPSSEILFSYSKQKDIMIGFREMKIRYPKKERKRVFFGLRLCDISAISALDKIFLSRTPDMNYKDKRDKSILIGFNCSSDVLDNCFCASLNLRNDFDLFFYDIGEYYYIEVKTEGGLKLVSRLKDYDYETEKIINRKKLERKDIGRYYDSEEWKSASKDCIGCGLCTMVCPSCLCFREEEFKEFEAVSGERIRCWTSCQQDGFRYDSHNSPVHMNKSEKLKHRVYHKLHYFKKRHGFDMCSGCGRCITHCPSKIDFVKLINRFVE